jgi:ribosomal protein L11 methylase PrmA
VASCRDQRVADLGCGLGHLGFTALALGARAVVFADGSPMVVDRIARTISLNHLDERARTVLHQWGEPLPDAPFPLILGGDILYRPECFPALILTIASSLAPAGVCLLSEPRRRCEEELLAAVEERGLAWEHQRRDAGYSLLRITRL